MIRRLVTVTALLCASFAYPQTKTPLTQPHWQFGDQSGAPCAGCTLTTYLAGTTTPTPTYTDASGVSQNTNPIILDASGSAMIWVGTPTIKLVLKDSLGSIIWTADNIPSSGSGSGGGCGFAGAITFENATVTGLDCDQYITINKTLHTVNVGGSLPTIHFTMTNLGTMLTGWTFDITTKSSAALSLGGGTLGAGKYIDGGTGNWTTLPSSGGTVTSVAATATGTPLSVTGSPITTSGTLAYTLAVTGSEAKAVTAAASGTTSNCAKWIATGGIGDSGSPCAVFAVTSGTNGVYTTFPCTVASVAQTCYQEDVNTGALNVNTPTTVTLPHSIPTAIFSIVCSDNSSRVQSGNDQAVGANVSGQIAPFNSIQVNTQASGMSAYCSVRGY